MLSRYAVVSLSLMLLAEGAPSLGLAHESQPGKSKSDVTETVADFSFDAADTTANAEVWDNPLFYDADVLTSDLRHRRSPSTQSQSPDAQSQGNSSPSNVLRDAEHETHGAWYTWLEFLPGKGDVVWVGRREGNRWFGKRRLDLPAAEYAAPTLTRDASGQVWLTYEARSGQQWDLFALPLEATPDGAAKRPQPRPISNSAGSDIRHRSCAGRTGLWVVWQGDHEGQFDIFARHIGISTWGPIVRVSEGKLGDWHPSVTMTSSQRVCVAWDAFNGQSYDVLFRCFENGRWKPQRVIASAATFEGRVDLAADLEDRVWICWEEGGLNWGMPFRGIQTDTVHDAHGPLHRYRHLRLAVIDSQLSIRQLKHRLPLPSVKLAQQRADRRPSAAQLGAFYERGRLTCDATGKPWIVYRHYYTPWLGINHRSHIEAGWGVYARSYGQQGWSKLYRFSIGQGDAMQRLEVAPTRDGIAAVWTTGRTHRTASPRPRGIAAATIRVDNTQKQLSETPPQANLPPRQSPPPPFGPADPRAATPSMTVSGTTYQLCFGDLHRHTDLSLCRVPLDGSIDDAYRYAIDAAQLDFLGITDHSRDLAQGDQLSQLWWRSRKEVYRHQLADTTGMRFIPFYAYERSHNNTADHNVISLRGDKLRPHTYPVPKFWQELDSQTVTIPHQPVRRDTWSYQSDARRPLVEIYQGCRDESIEADVHEGLSRGYHLGFIASSDHMSTSASYAGVWTPTAEREAVFRALQARRTFAATAKIELAVVANDKIWMGEVLAASTQPLQLSLTASGTAPILSVELIVDGLVAKTWNPAGPTVSLSESFDPRGRRYAYFRLRQRDGNEAWSSPIWFDGKASEEDI